MAGADEQLERNGADLLGRINRIPVWAFPPSFLAIIGMGYFFTFYDITDIGYAMAAIGPQFDLTGNESLFVALAVGLIGYIAGSYLIGTLADRYGRFNLMLLTMVLTAVGSFGDAAATGMLSLSIWRFVTGMGVGADLDLVSTYIGELAPPGQRGKISVFTFLIGIIGQAATPFVALALVPNYAIGWRLLFAIGGVIAVIALAMRSRLPESPRWLVLHGRLEEAERVVAQMEAVAAKKGVVLPAAVQEPLTEERGRFPTSYLFHRPYAGRLMLLVSMWFFWYIGNYGFLGDAPALLTGQHIAIANSILYLAIGGMGYPIGAIVMFALADRAERKILIFASTLIWLAGMVLIGTLANEVIISIGSFLGSLALGMYLQVAYTYTVESYPTRARASGFALSDGLGHIGGAVGALALPAVVASRSFQTGFTAIGVTGLIAGLLALAGPAATGRRLEQISQ